ncbi:MAG: 16S rRNA (guanine(966)-N(2))-methyltransferase RsmD [Pseudomonadota bacterium]
MRIIAGHYRGRKIVAAAGGRTRPTADRARETLFSMLTSRLGGFTDLAVADLFAGSGALGLEALSRGAASCLFVENDRDALEAIRTNIAALGMSGASVRAGSAEHPSLAATPYDLIFLDPPYGKVDCGALIDRLVEQGLTHSGTIISAETAKGDAPTPQHASMMVSRKVGRAMLHLFAVG